MQECAIRAGKQNAAADVLSFLSHTEPLSQAPACSRAAVRTQASQTAAQRQTHRPRLASQRAASGPSVTSSRQAPQRSTSNRGLPTPASHPRTLMPGLTKAAAPGAALVLTAWQQRSSLALSLRESQGMRAAVV